VHSQAPYNTRGQRDTRNSNDGIFRDTQNSDRLMLNVTKTADGYAATADVTVNLKLPTVSKAVITQSGVVNAASFQAGVAPGAWITIFGQNLATATRAVSTSDLINGNLPTTLGGVGVKVDGKDAFVQYVSPTQINVQAPADENLGSVQVVVTNSAGSSDPVTATLQTFHPAFFTSQTYVAAVQADGSVVTGVAVKPGALLSLYGNGFGPTNPSIAPGAVVQTAAALTNPVTITIGGIEAPASFAGLSGTGLYQFNVTVPTVAPGNQEVVAQIGGMRSPSGVYLKVQS
jgi:uncharacterized protein (TIGR03437 family)